MTHISKSALLNYSAQQMYELVNDVENYPFFMDGCVGSAILERGDGYVVAQLELSKGGVKQTFTTRNKLTPNEEIFMELDEGPFTMLSGYWCFQPLTDTAAKVVFDLKFEVTNKVVKKAMDKLLNSVANNMVDSLTRRARDIYGNAS